MTWSRQGYKILKTTSSRGRPGGEGRLRATWTAAIDDGTRTTSPSAWIGTLRDVVGPGIGIAVDVQFDYRTGGIVKLARRSSRSTCTG